MLPLFLVHVLEWLMLPLYVYVRGDVYCYLCSCQCICVRGSMLPLFISICMCYRKVNVARVHVHALGRSMLPLVMSMCMCLGEGNVVAVHVASIHVNAHVLRADQCCLCSWPCVKGG